MAESQQNNDALKSQSLNPPIIMKIDAPDDSNDMSTLEEDDNSRNECVVDSTTVQICSPTVSTSNPFSSPYRLASSILKPSTLSLNSTPSTKSSFILKPSQLNPSVSTADVNKDTCDKKDSQSNGETPKFVPLVQTDAKTNSTTEAKSTENVPVTSSSSFIFGQNLQDRVVSGEGGNDNPEPSTSVNSNGTSDMLFSSVISTEVKPDSTVTAATSQTKTLSESAKEYEESRANKRKYDEVEVKTGEEEEINVLSISCKLFSYDTAGGTWQERGRGILRLNDLEIEDNQTQSRLVFRTSGSLRVILNTKIWGEMTVDKASDKSIRLTAQDSNGDIKVFLIMASNDDSKTLFNHLQQRVQKEVASSQKRRKSLSESDTGGQ